MKIFKRIVIVLFSLVFVFIGYFLIYNMIYKLPSEPLNATELDYEKLNNDFYLSEDNYRDERSSANYYIKTYEEIGELKNGDITLAYSKFMLENPKASIVISHGYTECRDKYGEMIYYYLRQGYSVFMMDHRGHGKSSREVSDNSLVYIDSLDTYSSDLYKFISDVVKPNTKEDNKVILFAHSMGGGIATNMCEMYSDAVDYLILSAPMISANLGMNEAIANPIVKIGNILNQKTLQL